MPNRHAIGSRASLEPDASRRGRRTDRLETQVTGDATAEASQRVVCFTETPLEHIHLLTSDIDGRQIKFEPYGIALTKPIARSSGTNPVWYVDITPGHDWLTNPLNRFDTCRD